MTETAEVDLSPVKCQGILAVLWCIELLYSEGKLGLRIASEVDVLIHNGGLSVNAPCFGWTCLNGCGLACVKRKLISWRICGDEPC